jgi:hypothetical protein
MNIKERVKKAARSFFELKQEDDHTILTRSILVVDNGYCPISHVRCCLKLLESHFPAGAVTVVTFERRKAELLSGYEGGMRLSFAVPDEGSFPKRYCLSRRIASLRATHFDYIVLLSLDATPLAVSLFRFKARIVLFNQWRQIWSVRFRNLSGLFTGGYAGMRRRTALGRLARSLALFFVVIREESEEVFRDSVTIVDDGRASFRHVYTLVELVTRLLPTARVALVGRSERREIMVEFPSVRYIKAGSLSYAIARRPGRVILVSLDIAPVFAAFFPRIRRPSS